jgi:hypothetical protein
MIVPRLFVSVLTVGGVVHELIAPDRHVAGAVARTISRPSMISRSLAWGGVPYFCQAYESAGVIFISSATGPVPSHRAVTRREY